jgi:hypothetical protein
MVCWARVMMICRVLDCFLERLPRTSMVHRKLPDQLKKNV